MVTRAFTLLELLVVISIIAILVSTLLAGADILRKKRMGTQTDTIIQSLRLSIETTGASGGGTVSAVEHPLAGTAAPRTVFLRTGTWAQLDTTNMALQVQDQAWVASGSRSQIIERTDVYMGATSVGSPECPLLYGLRRGEIGIIGGSSDLITKFRRLPHKDTQYWDPSTSSLRQPYNETIYPNGTTLYSPMLEPGDTIESASRRVVSYVLGQTAGKELVDLKAVYDEAAGTLLSNDRVRTDSKSTSSDSKWAMGRLRHSDGTWIRYRMRGQSIYDAWGNEILVSVSPRGALRISSAGPDGVFVWHPGSDGTYQTAAYLSPITDSPIGDDRPGLPDNRGDPIYSSEP